jgi:transposase
MMAYIMNQKFSCAMPLFRQEQEFKRMGIKLSRQTMSNWMISGANLLKPLYEKLRKHLASHQFIHADETPVEVLCEDGKEPTAKSYMWVVSVK